MTVSLDVWKSLAAYLEASRGVSEYWALICPAAHGMFCLSEFGARLDVSAHCLMLSIIARFH